MKTHSRRPLILGNWKMHMTVQAATAAVRQVAPLMPAALDREVAVAPPFTALMAVGEALAGSPVKLAAQDLFWEDEGPYTGEVSGPMLAEIGVEYVITGHSERRLYLGETDHMVNQKVKAALRAGLHPVICIGEDLEARSSGNHGRVVRDQLLRAIEGVPHREAARVAIAWEPIWAIGTGRTASPGDAAEMHALIRLELEGVYPREAARMRVLYGGSVNADNIDGLMACPEVDGVLVGGASLRPLEFLRIASFKTPV
jgi:triosephosphate isomerase